MVCALGALSRAATQTDAKPEKQTAKAFATPEEAVEALIQAAGQYDVPALLEIFGVDARNLIATEDPVADKNHAAAFAALARTKKAIIPDPKNSSRATVVVGNDEWPLPVPLLKRKGKWLFDSEAGREEILLRRIGTNELDAIQICRGYVEAQQEYALRAHPDPDVNQYAQRIISTPGTRDGLAWRNEDGNWAGPVGAGVAKAIEEGYSDRAQPYHGYYFKILKRQGPAAPLGDLNFVINGVMIGGFALAAAPAQYRVTGVQTFIVSHDGIVYQRDLGPDTLKVFRNMESYNPDKTWRRTDDEW
jgi:hypothetical protein